MTDLNSELLIFFYTFRISFRTGEFNNENVAVKFILTDSAFDRELEMYKALNATDDPNIEEKGIPRVFCYGSFESWAKEQVHFIAMTLFDGTLEARFKQQEKNISDLSLSLIFRRSVRQFNFH